MKPPHIFLFFLLLIFFKSIGIHADSDNSDVSTQYLPSKSLALLQSSPGARGLLSHEIELNQDPTILSSKDGSIFLMEKDSNHLIWRFSSGPSTFNLYQAGSDDNGNEEMLLDGGMEDDLDSNTMVDIGHGFELGSSERMLMTDIANCVRDTPHISIDGITLGEKRTTVFLLDAKDGSLVSAFDLGGLPPRLDVSSDRNNSAVSEKLRDFDSSHIDQKTVQLLYITRNDYLLKHCAPISGKVLWNLTISDFEAYFLHPEKKLPLKVMHFRDRRFVSFLLEKFKLSHADAMPFLTPETDTAVVEDLNSAPLALAGSADQSSSSLAIIPDVAQNNPSHAPKNVNYMPFPHSNHLNNMILCLLIVLLVSFLCYMGVISITWKKSTRQFSDSNENHTVVPKRKKPRRPGNKNGVNNKNNDRGLLYEEGEQTYGVPIIKRNGKEPWMNFSMPDAGANGRTVGRLFISNMEIAKGSNGTIVFEGKYDGRPVAVKRLVQAHHEVAYKEIQHLILSDRHPNIVRWYGVEHDADFIYLSLERCTCSLNDLIQICSVSSQHMASKKGNITNSVNGYNTGVDLLKGVDNGVELWKANGYPSTQLLKLMRDFVSGLAHLHELGIMHRDLKPQNILIVKEKSIYAKLSDMGISKRLIGDNASLGHHPTGFGSSGWQAPEQLLHGRQTRAVDLFSLGCVLFFCITGGKHPYGDHLERDINIVKNQVDLFLVEHIPEAVDLLSHLLDPNPESRPTASNVMHHPLFWSSEMRLSFLRDVSDRVELEDRENESDILKELENVAPVALGGKWDEKMEAAFLNNIGRYRRYKFDSTRDLLRVVRNKLNHYRELPKEIQEILGPVPEGFDGYFASRFPKFLIEVYKVTDKHCREEEWFQKYFSSSLL